MKKFIAYFDILGYGERINGKTIDEEYTIQEKLREDIKEIIEKNAKKRTDFYTIQFSDTHIFYTQGASEDDFEIIIKSSLIFMLMAACRKPPYFPMRGVIIYGDFKADHDKSIFVGEALREAYALEKGQEWMGCFLSNLCYAYVKNFKVFEEFLKKFILVKYPVPLKKGRSNLLNWFRKTVLRQALSKYESKYVVNMESFPRVFGKEVKNMPVTNPDFIENIFVNKGKENNKLLDLDKSAKNKMRNTKDFFVHVRDLIKKNQKG